MRIVLVTLALMSLTGRALAQDPDCDAPKTPAEMTACAEKAWREVDRDLNYTYKMALYSLEQIDSTLPKKQQGGAKALREAQQLWVKFRDKACEAEGFQAYGYVKKPVLVYRYNCYERLTRQQFEAMDAIATAN